MLKYSDNSTNEHKTDLSRWRKESDTLEIYLGWHGKWEEKR